jgi:mannose-1-phosphate guanylyltransferase
LRFKEKPDKQVAEEYVENGNFYWNSGVFLFNNLTMLKELKTYQPEILKNIAETKKHSEIKNKIIKLNNKYWKNISKFRTIKPPYFRCFFYGLF